MINGISANLGSIGGNNQDAPADLKKKLQEAGIPSDVISQGREAVMQYAQQNGIAMPEPPQKQDSGSIFAQNGTQAAQGSQSAKADEKEPPEELKQQLVSLGIPTSVISQGREAVMEYAKENNIQLPEPPQNQGGATGSRLNLEA
ncbi:MAG: hypothetical protein PHV37_02475 [Candidatus Gastranaerophilales bacterium]|nr:hypothetical protein [Candidatus Gastranaerophilales bacterium]